MGLALLVAMKVPNLEWVVVAGLGLFGFAFAVNSSVHSYLVLAYAGSEKAAEDVGFYYAANALGRFIGTLLSGLLYQWGGLLFSLVGSAAMLTVCWLVTLALPVHVRRAGSEALADATGTAATPGLASAEAGVRMEARP
jgi:predicted MFS family arabinose efflux permease